MKRKSILFVTLCLALCLIPSVGMFFFPTTRTTENRPMAAAPQLITEGKLNKNFVADLESYITEHLALRNQMIYADAKVQTGLFGESNVSNVISGSDGWLYYASTLDDYLGVNPMSERQLYNLAHNFGIMQAYAEEKNMDFLLTIAPNKNTLYGEHMPYYKDYQVSELHNAVALAPYLEQQGIRYLDLFRLFEEQEEVLYLKRDSHWNNKGACLAYNGIMDMLELPHEDYSGVTPKAVKNDNGDLNKMLYSFYGELEENYDYGLAQNYVYRNDVKSVEDGFIVTENKAGQGSMLMFRDSFGNTLIPFLSNEFAMSYYSKGVPHALERFAESYGPDCVVIQKVERNLAEYLETPPILTAPEGELPGVYSIRATATTAEIADCLNDMNYYCISGTVDPSCLDTGSEILVWVNGTAYRAYHTGENGFLLYLKKAALTAAEAAVEVYVLDDTCVQVLAEKISLS